MLALLSWSFPKASFWALASDNAGLLLWQRVACYSEQAGNNVVGMDTINQPLPIVMDKPAGDFRANTGVLPVIFLGAPGEKEGDAVMHRVSKMAVSIVGLRLGEAVESCFYGSAVPGLNPGPHICQVTALPLSYTPATSP